MEQGVHGGCLLCPLYPLLLEPIDFDSTLLCHRIILAASQRNFLKLCFCLKIRAIFREKILLRETDNVNCCDNIAQYSLI